MTELKSQLSRNFGLDVLRVVSILLVLIQHANILPISIQKIKIGAFGVHTFFVLSGYLIGEILIKELSMENSLKSIKKFIIRRWFRIVPLYYLILTIKFLTDPSIGINIINFFLFIQIFTRDIKYYNLTYSLVIEEWFYLLSPILISIYLFLSKSKNFLFLVFVFVTTTICEILQIFNNYSKFISVISKFQYIFYGVIIALLSVKYQYIFSKMSKSILINLFGFILILIAIFLIVKVKNDDPKIDYFPSYIKTIFCFGVSILIPCIYNFHSPLIKRLYIEDAISNLSKWTYAIYLAHPFVFKIVLIKSESIFIYFLSLLLAFLSTVVLAGLLYKFYERPLMNLRDKFT